MSKFSTTVLTAAMVLATGAAAATATDYTAIREDTHIHARLLAASKAYLIADTCPTIKERKFYLISQGLKLQSYARRLGYTNKEISAYVDDKTEQARFRAVAEPWVAAKGAVMGDADSYCAVGRAEIEMKTDVGAFLRTN